MPAFPRYPLVHPAYLSMLVSFLAGRQRSFQADACRLLRSVRPSPRVLGSAPNQVGSGLVFAVNHYHRPGFGAWWIAFILAASVPYEMHWMMTSAWVYPDAHRSWTVTPITRWLLGRIAASYRFTSTPPMPARPHELYDRAAAVRRLLRTLGRMPAPVLGIAPEGQDALDGRLQQPDPGVKRLLRRLVGRGMRLVPSAVWEEERELILHFGEPVSDAATIAAVDGDLAQRVMLAIAGLLPARLRGVYQ